MRNKNPFTPYFPKFAQKAVGIFVLAVLVGVFAGGNIILADPAFADNGTADGAAAVPAPPAGENPIRDAFNVNKYLKLPNQKSFVPANSGDTAGLKAPGVAGVLIKAIDLLMKMIGAVALIVFILGALLTILSEGKSDMLEKGKSAMVYALIGLAVAFFSFVIVTFVQSIFF